LGNRLRITTEEGEYCFLSAFQSEKYKDVEVKVEKVYEILLGETKYFAVKRKTETGELKIEEIKTNYGEEPKFPADADGWEWQKSDVWGNDPIEKLGTKSGVYWEKKWFRGSDNSNQPLADGIIRLIGRYWEEDKEDDFKIKLKTNTNFGIELKIVRPAKLLSDGQSDNYSKARDVFDKEYSIDSLCIVYGGKYGIPPQMLKGQMYTESAIKDFGGNIGNGFAPSYRYEPYTTQFDKEVLKEILDANVNPFIVTNTSMGKPGAAPVPTPLEHRHVLYTHYFQYPGKTVWDIVKENSSLEDVNNESSLYGFQYKGTPPDELKKGQLKSNSYSIVNNTYQDFLKGPKDNDGKRMGGYEKAIKLKYKLDLNFELPLPQQIEANELARVATIDFLKNKFNGGLTNHIAQTRIASSYGLLQVLYTTAYKEHNYPTTYNDRPENLNEVRIGMNYAVEHLKKLFNNWNEFSLETDNSWSSNYSGQLNKKYAIFPKPTAGFEQAIGVMHYKWNPGEQKNGNATYHKKVLNNSKRFLPRSN